MSELNKIALQILKNGRGVLAADESTATMTKRLDGVNVPSTAENRLLFRETLFSASSMPKCMFIESSSKCQCTSYASKNGKYPYLCNKHGSIAEAEILASERVDSIGNLINPSKINRFTWVNMSEHCVPMEWEPSIQTDLPVQSQYMTVLTI